MKSDDRGISKAERDFYLLVNKKGQAQSPDISKMQMVEMDARTKIYIALDASADEARSRYAEYLKGKKGF